MINNPDQDGTVPKDPSEIVNKRTTYHRPQKEPRVRDREKEKRSKPVTGEEIFKQQIDGNIKLLILTHFSYYQLYG